MKKLISVIAAAMCAFFSVQAAEYEYADNGDGTCVLTGVSGEVSGKVVLPSEINGLKVTSIGEGFEFNEEDEEKITELVIPDTVTEFYRDSFSDIGSWKAPVTITLPHKLEHIWWWYNYDQPGWCAFNSESLAKIRFSNGSTSNDAGTYHLVGDGNRMLIHCEEPGKTNLIALAGNLGRDGNHYKTPETIVVPDGVTSIAADVFDDMDRTKKISLPESLEELRGDIGLGWVYNLEEIEVRGTASPYKVIGNSLVDTRTKTLMQATMNTVIPNDGSVLKIASYSCINDLIKELVFPDAVEEIADYAAASTDGIEVIRIGKGVKSIGGGAFRSASADKLKCISISPENPYYEVVNGCVIRKTGNVFVSTAISRQAEKVYDDKWEEYTWIYDVEVPYFCEGILPESLDEDDSVRIAVLPKNVALVGWQSWYDPIGVAKGICIADCASLEEAKESDTYKNLKENGYLETDEELAISYTSKPQVAVRTVGLVTVQGYGRYAPGIAVTLTTTYVEEGKQAVWYKVDRENNTSLKVAAGNTHSFTMPSDNVFYSVELIDLPKVTVAISGNAGTSTVLGAGSYATGDNVTLKATAAKGYVFTGWYQGETLVSTAISYSFTMPEQDVAYSAKFAALSEENPTVEVRLADEYATGTTIDPISVDIGGCFSQPKVSVKGLPSGLKFTAKDIVKKGVKIASANTIYGTLKKSGVYKTTITVTASNKKTDSTTVTFTVLDRNNAGESFLKIDCDSAKGTVKGDGIYAKGKKVTLKATPNKGYAFAGWYKANGTTALAGTVDYRAKSFPYVATGTDTTLVAKFVTQAEDAASLELTYDLTPETINVAVESLSLPKGSVSGLPSGLKFDTKNYRLVGSITKPGTYNVKIKLSNSSNKKEYVIPFTTGNLTAANDKIAFSDETGSIITHETDSGLKFDIPAGVAQSAPLGLTEEEIKAGAKLSVKGLPSGLKYNAKTGKIEGVATKAGTYTIYVTVKEDGVPYVSTFTVEVKALPSWAVGIFEGVGFCKDSNGEPDEEILWGTLTIADNGKIKGKMMYETEDERLLTATISEKSLTAYDPATSNYYCDITLTFKDGNKVVSDTYRFTVAPENYDEGGTKVGTVSYEDNDLAFELYQNTWKVKSFAGSKPVFAQSKTTLEKAFSIHGDADVKDGTVTLTLNIDKNGAVSGTILAQGWSYEWSYDDKALVAFEEKFAINKTNLIITEYVAATSVDEKRHYSAIVPIVINKKDVKGILYAEVKLSVSQDGKIYQEDCEITTHTDIGDWSE